MLAIVTGRAVKYGVTGIPIFAAAKAKPQLMPRLRLPRSILAPRQSPSVCGPNGCN
ncbi:MAG: hypothetical protein H0T51_07790 [Pirellulales bacterium]|nr:hypothetical protein [Pirellulales bacterium]